MHNILLVHDGHDDKYYDENFWLQVDPEDDDDSNEEHDMNGPFHVDKDTIDINKDYTTTSL